MKRKVVNKFKGNAKRALLRWVQCTSAKYATFKLPFDQVLLCDYGCARNSVIYVFFRNHGIEVKDFGPSWRDGVAFQSVVHSIRPDLVDMEVVRRRSNRENLEEAFALAENELGIPRLLDPEGDVYFSLR